MQIYGFSDGPAELLPYPVSGLLYFFVSISAGAAFWQAILGLQIVPAVLGIASEVC